jgi:thiol:disulfide interchange protein
MAALIVPLSLLLPEPRAASTAPVSGALAAQRWSEGRVAALRREGRPVFVYFTADWCVSCKVNEAAAIDRAETAAAFRAVGVQTLVADWTNADPAIARELARHGRNSVPLYLWYPAGGGAPETLPQLLTPAMLAVRARAAP